MPFQKDDTSKKQRYDAGIDLKLHVALFDFLRQEGNSSIGKQSYTNTRLWKMRNMCIYEETRKI